MVQKFNFNEQCITYSQMNMISNARLFWRRYTTWIRVYLISRYLGLGTEEEAFDRMYFETSGIGNFLQILFELQSSNEISQQLSQITISLRDLVTAQFQGDTEAMNQSVDRLYQNAENFAVLLSTINPYINEAEWKNMMNLYIQYTIQQANSFVTGNYSEDIELFRRLTELTDRMGEIFAESIYNYINSGAQVIPLDDQQCVTLEQMNQIYIIRMFWFELVTWTRAYMLSRYLKIGNENEIMARLRQVPEEYVGTLRQIFGEGIEPSLQLINEYIDLIDALITAQIENDTEEIDRIVQLLYQNADQRAAVVASINPYWDQNEWENRLRNHVSYTIDESVTLQTGDYARNLDVFRALLDQAESASGYYARGIFRYITSQQMQIQKLIKTYVGK